MLRTDTGQRRHQDTQRPRGGTEDPERREGGKPLGHWELRHAPQDSAIPVLGTYPREMGPCVHQEAPLRVFMALYL